MRRFQVTSPHFTGPIDLYFDTAGALCMIDANNAEIAPGQFKRFLSKAEVLVEDLQKWFEGTEAQVKEVPLDVTFEMFWSRYAKKINKVRCVKLWERLTASDRIAAYIGVKKYDHYLKIEAWRSKADPETFLRNRYWENDY